MRSETQLRAWLDQAHAAFAAGEVAEAERCAKAVSALVRAEREIAELEARAPPEEEDEEALRAELRSRIRRLVDAEGAGAPDEVLERIASGASAS